ncbi:HLH-domain-containing protein, partial [Heliocybe sulcata]
KQAALASEKRRRRRESHNAVERRRRDNINEKISELATLIPECMLDGATASTPTEGDVLAAEPPTPGGASTTGNGNGSGGEKEEANGVVKANKGMILRKSVEYIRYLQQLVSAQASRNRDLEQQLSVYRAGSPGSP